jgi:hypothetical protein
MASAELKWRNGFSFAGTFEAEPKKRPAAGIIQTVGRYKN